MIKSLRWVKNFLSVSLLPFLFSTSVWATDSTTLPLPSTNPSSTVLWKTGELTGVYVPEAAAPVSYMVANQCPSGLNPSYNVAVRQGFIASSGSSEDKGIRGIHLKVNKMGTDPTYKEIYLNFSEAYVDTVGETDKPVDVSYWIYCGP